VNERIRELAEKCWVDDECGYGCGRTQEFDQEKFAELIVRECAGIVADAVDHREPASTYIDKIKQHFGVES
jgi:hypothetical protein